MASPLGGGAGVRWRPARVTHNCTKVHGAVLAQVDVLGLEGCAHLEVPWACRSRDIHSSLAVTVWL